MVRTWTLNCCGLHINQTFGDLVASEKHKYWLGRGEVYCNLCGTIFYNPSGTSCAL